MYYTVICWRCYPKCWCNIFVASCRMRQPVLRVHSQGRCFQLSALMFCIFACLRSWMSVIFASFPCPAQIRRLSFAVSFHVSLLITHFNLQSFVSVACFLAVLNASASSFISLLFYLQPPLQVLFELAAEDAAANEDCACYSCTAW
jgi:hypothetical protein